MFKTVMLHCVRAILLAVEYSRAVVVSFHLFKGTLVNAHVGDSCFVKEPEESLEPYTLHVQSQDGVWLCVSCILV